MPADRAKVLTALNLKFKGKSVDKNYKESIATKWAAKITDDDGIDDFINDREDDVLEYMKAKDAAVTTAIANTKQDAADTLTGNQKQDESTEPIIPDGTPDWMKTFMANQAKQMEALTNTVTGLQASKQAETLEARFKSHEDIKAIAEKMPQLLKGRIPTTEEGFEAAVAEFKADFAPLQAQFAVQGFGNDMPAGGATGGGAGKGKVDPAIQAFAAKKVEEFKQSKN